jgi:hypothetical protein
MHLPLRSQAPKPAFQNPDTDPKSAIDTCKRDHLFRTHGQCHLP